MLGCFMPTTRGDSCSGILYPRESETREVHSLDGIWNFRLSKGDPREGFESRWYESSLKSSGETIPMPVPSSYNDITQDGSIRDHMGLVWYDRTFFVPVNWRKNKSRVWLRFGSVHYAAQAWINGQLAMAHEIGHLPFQAEVTSFLKFGEKNRVTVVVDNTLLADTIPQGTSKIIETESGPVETQSYTFDFFNYAGIHRSVHLYTTPAIYIADITVATDIEYHMGIVSYKITYGGDLQNAIEPMACVQILDQHDQVVAMDNNDGSLTGVIRITKAELWWPYLMDSNPGYMYNLEVRLTSKEWESVDVYRLPFGIRTLKWNCTTMLINGKPIYLRGFGKHEDSDIRGKGLDLPLIVKDYNLLKWIGANSYRTSHYPYAEEIMDMADRLGIMIIDECSSVDTEGFTTSLLEKHKGALEELIRRDKNHPSVIMWSLSNEASTSRPGAEEYVRAMLSWRQGGHRNERYYRELSNFVRNQDSSRPITIVTAQTGDTDVAVQFVDIIGFNRYNGWYTNAGKLKTIQNNIIREVENWREKQSKPVYVAEYGADTIAGLHFEPSYVWSEEYQTEFLAEHFKAFDHLRKKGALIGEMIWNFADFNTAQTYTRAGGNKKGIFTRNRQPKSAAHLVRRRYFKLAQELDNADLPCDLDYYVIS